MPDLDAAVRNLERATGPAPLRVFDDLTLAALTNHLVDAYTRTDEARQAAARNQLTVPPG